MANTFKNAFAASVNHSAYVDLYTVPSSTTTVILGLALCNKTANAVNVTVVSKIAKQLLNSGSVNRK